MCIVFCILLIGGASPPIQVRYKIQCGQKVGQKKWSKLDVAPQLRNLPLVVWAPSDAGGLVEGKAKKFFFAENTAMTSEMSQLLRLNDFSIFGVI